MPAAGAERSECDFGTVFGGLGELKPWRVAVSWSGGGRTRGRLGRTCVQASVFRTCAVRQGRTSRRIYGRDGSESEGEKWCAGRHTAAVSDDLSTRFREFVISRHIHSRRFHRDSVG